MSDRKNKRMKQMRQNLLKTIGDVFDEFDEDESKTLDSNEISDLVEVCRERGTIKMLEQVGIRYDRLVRATEVADYDHSKRKYDPDTNVTYTGDDIVPSGAKLQTHDTHILPEGVTEQELVKCLSTMDDPLTQVDYFAMMKAMRLIDR